MLPDFLKKLPEKTRQAIFKQAWRIGVKKGTMVLSQNAPSCDIYCIESGHIKAVDFALSGRETLFYDLKEGSYFNEESVFIGPKRNVSYWAQANSTLLVLPCNTIKALLLKNPNACQTLIEDLCQTIREYAGRFRGAVQMSVKQRVYQDLLRRSQGANTFIRPKTIEQWASMVDTARETLTRLLSSLEKEGVIQQCGKEIVIKNALVLLRELGE